MTRCGGTIFDRQLWTRQLSIVDPPIVDPPIMDLPIVDPPIVDPPIVDPPNLDPPIVNLPIVDPPIVDPPIVDPPIVDPPIVDPPIVDLPIVDPPIVDPPIDPLHYMKFGYSRASATALVRTRVCSGTQFSQVNSQKIRYFDISSRPKTATFLGFVLPQTFLTFRRRVFSPTLRNLAAATSWKISVKGFPRRVKRAFWKPVFHR